MTPEESAVLENFYKYSRARWDALEALVLAQQERITRLEHEVHVTRERLLLLGAKNLAYEVCEEGVKPGDIH